MKNIWIEFFGTLFVITVITAGILVAMFMAGNEGRHLGVQQMQREAVLLKHAEYAIDEDGSPKWQWKAILTESK